jgi:hypothetical protein
MSRPKFVPQCPSCQAVLEVTRLSCSSCHLQVEGHFAIPPLLRLPPDDLRFVERFVRASGSLKEVAKLEGKSYPTIRNRLDAVIAKLDHAPDPPDARRARILDGIAAGTITPEEGALQLKEIAR